MGYYGPLISRTLTKINPLIPTRQILDFSKLKESADYNFYTPVEDGTYYGITRGGRAGGRRPVLCQEHISKTTLARVMKFHGWIDLIQGECSAQES